MSTIRWSLPMSSQSIPQSRRRPAGVIPRPHHPWSPEHLAENGINCIKGNGDRKGVNNDNRKIKCRPNASSVRIAVQVAALMVAVTILIAISKSLAAPTNYPANIIGGGTIFAGTPMDTSHWPWNAQRMGDGCKHVYLDLGSNIGVHNRFLFQPEFYPKTSMRAVFNEAFGSPRMRSMPSNESGICAFAFEANPMHAARLRAMDECYLDRGHRLKVFVPNAVSDDGGGSLYFEGKVRGKLWTAGMVVSKNRMTKAPKAEYNYTEIIGVDIASFINQHVKDREYDRGGGLGKVVAKLDVEGSEYKVLPHMEGQGVLCEGIVDLITTEFHYPFYSNYIKDKKRFPTSESFHTYFLDNNKKNLERKKGKCGGGRPTVIELRDSEDYKADDENPLQRTCLGYEPLSS